MARAGDDESLSPAHLRELHGRTSFGKWRGAHSVDPHVNYIVGPEQSWRQDNFERAADVDEMALLHNAVPELIALLDAIEAWKNGAKYGETDLLSAYRALTEFPSEVGDTSVG